MSAGTAIDRSVIDAAKRDRALLVTELEQAGAGIRGKTVRCPFHEDRSASGSICERDGVFLYVCHAAGCGIKGDIFAIVMQSRGCSFPEAVEYLGLNSSTPPRRQAPPTDGRARPRPSPTGLHAAQALGVSAHQFFISDSETQSHLWQTRAIDAETARRFGVGITGDPGRRYWTLPIWENGKFVGLKRHAADGQKPKGLWSPEGVTRDHLWPVSLEPEGPVWLCPGELKALAVIAVGQAAVGITSGEGADLPDRAIDILRDRHVALVPDDDKAGREWGDRIVKQLRDGGVDVHIVDLALDADGGRKDVGDFIVEELKEHKPSAVAATFVDRYARSDPWRIFSVESIWSDPRTWEPVEHIPTGFESMDHATHGGLRVGGVHLFVGRTGQAKSQVVTQIAHNCGNARIPAAVYSLELSCREVGHLLMAQAADIPRNWFNKGPVRGEAAERFDLARRDRGSMPLMVFDDEEWPGGLSRDGLARRIRRGVRRFGWRLVVVDYLGLLAPGEADRSDYHTDFLNSTTLRRIARENNVALVVVAALRKSGNFKNASSGPITINDVSGAGRLVYDATSVWLVESEHASCRAGDRPIGLVNLSPLKLRFSAPLDEALQLRWHPGFGRICDLESTASGGVL